MDQVKSNFYENQILEAIETVANGIVSKIKFDQTILCTITNDKNRKKGIYEVTDGTSTFEACSNDDSYKKDMIVYVLIPQGDYENQKTIIGKYVDDTSSAINYTSMMDSFISVEGFSNDQEYSLIANHPDRRFINIPINVGLKGANQYNCVGIQADFKTDLSQEHIIAGNYGLVLTLYGEDASTGQSITPKSYGLDCSEMYGDPYNYNFYFTQSMVFDLAKDFANTKITNATISFYQNKNFKTLDNKELSHTYSTTHTYIDENGVEQTEKISRDKQPNLFVKNVVLKFGYNLSDITEESIRLYSLNDTKYINRSDEKNISLKWFVKNEVEEKLPYLIIDNEEEAANEKLTGDYSIYWYRYVIDNSTKDPLAGVYWNIIPEGIHNDKIFVENKESKKNELTYRLEENPKGKYAKVNDAEDGALILATKKNTIKYDVKIYPGKRYNDTSPDETKDPFTYTFGPNELLSREKIKAILVRNEWKEVLTEGKGDDNNTYVHFEDASKYYESNELVYENANPASQNLASVDLIRNMKLECQDGSNGIYKVYNSVDNKALGSEANRIRILNVIFDTYSTIDIPTAELENCSIKWKIPKNNSMIEPVDFSFTGPMIVQKSGSEIKIEEDDKNETTVIEWETGDDVSYYECNYPWSSSIAGKDEHHEGALLYTNYRIKEDYSQAYNNNTIICEITKYNKIYRAEIEFLFGESGTNGTGYTLSIRLDKEYDSSGNASLTPVSCITADASKKVKLVATLFDQFGNDISDQQTVIWNFKNKINKGLVLDSDYIKYDGTTDISKCYGIIMATSTVEWKGKAINLQAYLPIGVKPKDSDIFTYNGTTKIIYDAQGIQSTYQQIHNLYDRKDNDISVNKWQVSVLEQKDKEDWNKYIPYFVKDENDSTKITNILATKNMYFIELSAKQIVIQALNTAGDVLYQQSILYDQNRFGSALFNEWDGSLVIDEVENKILSALIGAGKKETDNTFSGVLIGDFSKNGSVKTGLLGFKNSLETFGFHTDGTAFIGPSEQGRIEFDGTKGIIESYTGNTRLNLTTGEIYLSNDDEQSAKIILDSTGTSGYFSIKDKVNNKNLIYIGSDNYFLQSKNFAHPSGSGENEVVGTGVRFDLNSGKLTGYDFLIQAGQGSEKLIINSDSGSKPLTIGSKFSVTWDGTMNATGGTFSGTLSAATGKFSGEITAETGTIGGWTINKYGLHKGGAFDERGENYTVPSLGSYAVFSPKGTTLVRSDTEKIKDIVFNIGKNLAIDKNGVIYATGAQLGGYTTSTEFSEFDKTLSGKINDINTLIGKMNSSYGSIIKIDGDLGSTATFLAKGDDVSGYKGEGYYNSNNKNFYSNYNKENNTYDGLISPENDYIYYDILTSQMYLYKNNQYSVYDAKFFNVSKEGLLTANNAVISGTIYATNGWFSGGIIASEGEIAGWTIGQSLLVSDSNPNFKALYKIVKDSDYQYMTGLQSAPDSGTVAFFVKRYSSTDTTYADGDTNMFYVKNNGEVFASNLIVQGKLEGKDSYGNIGFRLNSNGDLYSNNAIFNNVPSSDNYDASDETGVSAANPTIEFLNGIMVCKGRWTSHGTTHKGIQIAPIKIRGGFGYYPIIACRSDRWYTYERKYDSGVGYRYKWRPKYEGESYLDDKYYVNWCFGMDGLSGATGNSGTSSPDSAAAKPPEYRMVLTCSGDGDYIQDDSTTISSFYFAVNANNETSFYAVSNNREPGTHTLGDYSREHRYWDDIYTKKVGFFDSNNPQVPWHITGYPAGIAFDGDAIPDGDERWSLGSDDYKWWGVYSAGNYSLRATSETYSNVSDARLKDIQYDDILKKALLVYNNLTPVAYKYKNLQETDEHSRTHIGFIAQEVEQEIIKVGLTNEDFAAVQIEQLKNPIPGCEDSKKYYLNYNELHGLHVLKNQEQDKRILELEQKVQYLENKILELSGKGV